MATSLEDSLTSTLEYDAEVAYISATSPVAAAEQRESKTNREPEFDFSLEAKVGTVEVPRMITSIQEEKEETDDDTQQQTPATPVRTTEAGNQESPKEQTETVNLILMSDPKYKKKSTSPDPQKGSHLTPLLPPPHYMLDTASTMPGTPTSKLRLIKEAQSTPPSPKLASPKAKFGDAHNYKILVIYGSSGCGRTHLVQKLVHSNPAVFAKVVSTTTRKQRANEVDGVDFHFISHKDISTGLARGEFIEYVQIKRQKRDEKRRKSVMSGPDQGSQGTTPPTTTPHHLRSKRSATLTQLPTDQSLVTGHRFESLFDLTEEDSPVLGGGEVFGTTHQSLMQATQQGKSCVVMNVSIKGAAQLKKAGINAAYVCVYNKKIPKSGTKQEISPNYTIFADNMERAYIELKQYAFQLIQDLNLAQSTKYEIAKHEWDSLPTIEFESKQSVLQKKVRPVTFSEILSHFQNADMTKKIGEVKSEQPKRVLSHFFSRSGTKLSKKLQHEKLLVLAIARCSLNDRERLHLRTLQTIYSKLTGSSLNCRRFGSHWKDIGFNGVDPADDLQGVGFLGLVQLVHFLDNPRTMPIAQEIFRHCREESHQIPFCVLSINFTQIALAALQDGSLNKTCNKRDQVFVVVNEFYMAMFYRYFQKWKSQHKTILELGPLIQETGEYAKANLKEVVHEFDELLTRRDSSSTPNPESLLTAENPFTPLDKITDV